MAHLRTFADVKRRAVPGARVTLVAHYDPAVTIGLVQAVYLASRGGISLRPGTFGRPYEFLYWPLARDVQIDDADTFTVVERDNRYPLYTYRFV